MLCTPAKFLFSSLFLRRHLAKNPTQNPKPSGPRCKIFGKCEWTGCYSTTTWECKRVIRCCGCAVTRQQLSRAEYYYVQVPPLRVELPQLQAPLPFSVKIYQLA